MHGLQNCLRTAQTKHTDTIITYTSIIPVKTKILAELQALQACGSVLYLTNAQSLIFVTWNGKVTPKKACFTATIENVDD